MTANATPINRTATVVQPLVSGRAVAKRLDPVAQRWEYLIQWTGQAGELHEVWYPETRVLLGD